MLRILLAEDDANHATLARQALEEEGHLVTTVPDGRVALDTIAKEPFDLILLDMRLPRVDGREFIGLVRADKTRLADIPIVVLTGYGLRQHMDFFKRFGVRDYLAKPYDCDELATIIRSYDHR
ncbi:response regulator receiver protein [Solidesulfovibrio fructosivorans JJ]]|uniref:Response regulator receiver protein n=1 Tax=Solidesulfovibrio fructosivorans JJ] TaxID=596151 RepID=E1JRQ0_SOLFR|nr:response regulator [Solidesulfovibrio fructosivorans]EFL53251.1 response regulator receiver protein [Solidesulfovibrio fructosivorans JJ]]